MFVLRRIVLALVAWVTLSLGVFALFDLTPGRAGDELAFEGLATSTQRSLSPATTWRERYGIWLHTAARGDLGHSRSHGRPVASLMFERARLTAQVAWPAVAITWLLALPLGFYAGLRPKSPLDSTVMAGTSALGAVPDIVLAFMLLWCAVMLGVFTTLGTSASEALLGGAWRARALPVALLVLVQLPILVRHVRATVRNLADQPFARAARARGVSEHQFAWRHVLRLASPSLAVLAAQSIAGTVGGTLVAETVFSWPGLGALLHAGAMARDEPLVVATVLAMAAFVMVVNLAADVVGAAADPRPAASTGGD